MTVTTGARLSDPSEPTGPSAAGVTVPVSHSPLAVAGGLLRNLRPKQWVKSVLVPAAPAAAGMLDQWHTLWQTIVAVIAFSLCASGGYLINDAADVEQDRQHPTKRFRPMAAGIVPVWLGRAVGIFLVIASVVAGGILTTWQFSVVLAGYMIVTISYSTWLKHVAIVELMAVATGFLLRPIAGAAATHVPMSQWFLIVASFGSLYMVAGKRYAEVRALGDGASSHRRILSEYPPEYLRQTRELCAAVTLVAYCLWAFERASPTGPPWAQLSIVPITFGLLRYALLLERGQGGAPEEVVLRDVPLLLTGLVWVVLFLLGVWKVGA